MAKIIICDDDEALLDMLYECLSNFGHNVIRAYDVSQLWTLMKDQKPDLLILDMQMPGGGGPGAMNNLRRIGASDMPLIIYSGMPADKQLVWAHDRGLVRGRFLQKPLDLFDLASIINEICPPPTPESIAAKAAAEAAMKAKMTDLRACHGCGVSFESADAGVGRLCPKCFAAQPPHSP